MKEYIRTLKELTRIKKSEFVFYGGISLIGAVLGIVMVFVIMAVDGTGEDYGELGSLFALMMGAIVMILGGIYGTQTDFNMAISMGKARKHFVPAKYILLVTETIMLIGVALLVGWIEGFIYNAIYPLAINELHISAWLDYPSLLVGVALGIPAIVMLLGALLMLFGQKFFWVIWALWMLGCMGFPRIINAAVHESEAGKFSVAVVRFIAGLPKGSLTIAMYVLIAVAVAANYLLLRKQRVTA